MRMTPRIFGLKAALPPLPAPLHGISGTRSFPGISKVLSDVQL